MKLLFLIGFLIFIIIIGIWYNSQKITEGFYNNDNSESNYIVSEQSESFVDPVSSSDTPAPSPSPSPSPDASPSPSPSPDPSPSPSSSPAPPQSDTQVPTTPAPTNTVPQTAIPTTAFERYNKNLSGITQIGGEGPNNYFHPNIIIRRKKDNNNVPPHRHQQNPNLMPTYIQDFSSAYYDNTGYNISNNQSESSSQYDALDSGYRNATSSYQADVEQTGVCLDCVEDPSTDSINYSGRYDDFADVEESMAYDATLYDSPRPRTAPNYRKNTEPNNQLNNEHGFVHSCKMKKFEPGYQIQPPKCWDMPHKRPPVCLSSKKQLPAAVFDRGTPLNALDLDTGVGSIMPKFQYNELPRNA